MKIDLDDPKVVEATRNFNTTSPYFNKKIFDECYRLFFSSKALIKKFIKKGDVNEKLLINKIIILNNNFRREFIIKRFMEILNYDELSVVKSIMIFLSLHLESDFPIAVPENRVFSDILRNLANRYHLRDSV